MIYILGGKGFVGSAIVRHCTSRTIAHTVITRENYGDLKGEHCNVFINANGNSKKFMAEERPLAEFDASVRSVRASLSDFSFDYYVHLSSCDVYPDCSSPVTTHEDMELDLSRQSRYGFHKYLGELCVQHMAKRWLIVRMGGVVGSDMKKNPIFDILNGGPLWLDPASALQYMHTDVLAKLLFEMIERNIENQIINMCGRGTVSLKEVIDCVGGNVTVKPGSPVVRYEVSIERLWSIVSVPDSHGTVLEFVAAQRRQPSRQESHSGLGVNPGGN